MAIFNYQRATQNSQPLPGGSAGQPGRFSIAMFDCQRVTRKNKYIDRNRPSNQELLQPLKVALIQPDCTLSFIFCWYIPYFVGIFQYQIKLKATTVETIPRCYPAIQPEVRSSVTIRGMILKPTTSHPMAISPDHYTEGEAPKR